MNLFAYGTLMDPRAIAKVIGRTLPNPIPARLQGYRKWETTLGYPVVLPESVSVTEGMLFFSLTESDWKRLDIYENVTKQPPSYFRRLVTVGGTHGNVSAYVYIGNLNFFRTRLIKE